LRTLFWVITVLIAVVGAVAAVLVLRAHVAS
jgi:hypothetical protein